MKALIIFVSCFFICAIQAESLENYLIKNYGYQRLKLSNNYKELDGPYLIGEVNNSKAYIMFDTGSNGISIFNDSVNQLKLKESNSLNHSKNMAGQSSINHDVLLKQIKIGNIVLKNINAETINQPKKIQYPTIIIGTKFLDKYNAIFNFSNQSIYLSTRHVTPKDHYLIGQKLYAKNFLLINLTKLISQHQIIPIAFNKNSPVNCLVDTGTSDFTVSDTYSKKIGLKTTSKETIKATDGTLTIANTNISSLTLNPLNIFYQKKLQLFNLNATSANIESLSKFLGIVCILGFKELKDTKSIYDFSAARLYIKS
ncbi:MULTISPECIES: retroviral-like aspartic protease family protein [unclassified Francisella]|uniref:retroviral-like aspartic protease family protein n=1 Tax=unclassified Francisella TaxID=2610885 RepID=UPI002E3565F0|nr:MULTISPECIES: aspartyl protease family protein [unclassified Francisella]MED7820330.1 aspartyl protease family protein [Francisella sp. 19S2-4]MED7831165.1 aspartyl protease family protein [Francisella sp. 19S2-10]